MSLKRTLAKIEIEKRKIKETARDFYMPWIFGGVLVTACLFVDTCEKAKPDYHDPHPTKTESYYQDGPSLAYSAKNIKHLDDKF
jgi:hypothetical protein